MSSAVAAVASLLDFDAATLRALAEAVGLPSAEPSLADRALSDRALAGRVVAVLPFASVGVPAAGWLAAAQSRGAGVLRIGDIDDGARGPLSPFAVCDEAARWADVLVTTHELPGFARAVAERTGRAVVNGGEVDGEDPAAGLSLLAAILRRQGAAATGTAAREPHVAVCGDLRSSASARALLGALAGIEATVLLVPAPGRDLPEDHVQRLARRTRSRPVRFPAKTTSSLLDVVDTVLLAPENASQLPLFREVGVPPGPLERRARREIEDTDALFVAGSGRTGAALDRLVAEPFRGRGRSVPEGREHRTSAGALGALLAFAVGDGAARDATGVRMRYRGVEGVRCAGPSCVGHVHPADAPPDFAVVAGDDLSLECLYCGTRVTASWGGSREVGRYHAMGSSDARRVLDQNLVLFVSASDAERAGFTPSRRGAQVADED